MVAITQTLTLLFGSGVTAPGTGVLLNDNVNLFDPRPGGPNAVDAGKRPVADRGRSARPWDPAESLPDRMSLRQHHGRYTAIRIVSFGVRAP